MISVLLDRLDDDPTVTVAKLGLRLPGPLLSLLGRLQSLPVLISVPHNTTITPGTTTTTSISTVTVMTTVNTTVPDKAVTQTSLVRTFTIACYISNNFVLPYPIHSSSTNQTLSRPRPSPSASRKLPLPFSLSPSRLSGTVTNVSTVSTTPTVSTTVLTAAALPVTHTGHTTATTVVDSTSTFAAVISTQSKTSTSQYQKVMGPTTSCTYNHYYAYTPVNNTAGPNNDYVVGIDQYLSLCDQEQDCQFAFFIDIIYRNGMDGAFCIRDNAYLQCRFPAKMSVGFNKVGSSQARLLLSPELS
ncbi:hypothetical protein D9758_001505 [Tetrapyrgos nigripes]|uniref:Uncharacterized protein n=1 Tax=Tetrapyrgos nigripes TaxID=182062 RepID=A0A8H5LWY0_9AGAR|nr:hypothetical protein D9758_001505 [Tetrapyrgos nigripes]